MLPRANCRTGLCMKTLSGSAELVFTLQHSLSTAVMSMGDEVILFIAQLVVMQLCLALNTCHCCLSSLPHLLSPLPISLAAEII